MVVGICIITLHLPGNASLKGKRGVVKSVLARLRQEFNVSAAEVASQESWQEAVLGLACISTSRDYAHGLLEKAVQWIEEQRPDVTLVDYQIEWY